MCVYLHIYIYTRIYIYMYLYMYSFTHIYTYIKSMYLYKSYPYIQAGRGWSQHGGIDAGYWDWARRGKRSQRRYAEYICCYIYIYIYIHT